MAKSRATAPTRHIAPIVFKFLRGAENPVNEATIIRHFAPIVNEMGYRARKMSGEPYRHEAYIALKTLRHNSLIDKGNDGTWRLTPEGRSRPATITEDEAEAMVRRRAEAEKGQGKLRRSKVSTLPPDKGNSATDKRR